MESIRKERKKERNNDTLFIRTSPIDIIEKSIFVSFDDIGQMYDMNIRL
jgi:hypothetical protein